MLVIKHLQRRIIHLTLASEKNDLSLSCETTWQPELDKINIEKSTSHIRSSRVSRIFPTTTSNSKKILKLSTPKYFGWHWNPLNGTTAITSYTRHKLNNIPVQGHLLVHPPSLLIMMTFQTAITRRKLKLKQCTCATSTPLAVRMHIKTYIVRWLV